MRSKNKKITLKETKTILGIFKELDFELIIYNEDEYRTKIGDIFVQIMDFRSVCFVDWDSMYICDFRFSPDHTRDELKSIIKVFINYSIKYMDKIKESKRILCCYCVHRKAVEGKAVLARCMHEKSDQYNKGVDGRYSCDLFESKFDTANLK